MNCKTLVIILSETREYEKTFMGFKTNVLDVLNADLCLCIGVKSDYNYENPFYKTAKYCFTYNEPDDYRQAFEDAYQEIINSNHIVDNNHWTEYLKIKNHILGGVKDEKHQHPGSAGILLFYRWFLLQNLVKNGLIDNYDRFIITRSDFIYRLPHPRLMNLHPDYIWIPDGEKYGGYTDRHVVLNKKTIEPYLNIFTKMITQSNQYIQKMQIYEDWNLEKLIKFHLEQQGFTYPQNIRFFPYIMYAIRSKDGTTRWQTGTFNETLGIYIKYEEEFQHSLENKKQLIKSWKSNFNIMDNIDLYYRKTIYKINK